MNATASEPTQPVRVLRDDGTADVAYAANISDEVAVALYEHMVLARELDEHLVLLQKEGRVSEHASSAGEEAAILGAAAGMLDDDWLFLGQKEGAAALWRGVPPSTFAQRAFGTAADPSKGRCSPGPPFRKMSRIAAAGAAIGTQIPHAVGVAWAARLRREDVAVLAFFGDGATSTGDFHTGLNFAGVMKAPFVAFCRNNGWATPMPASRQTFNAGVAVKAVAYGLRGVRVDGTDVLAVLSVVQEARARASSGLGGTLVEALTAPMRPSADAEPANETAWVRDPIVRLRRYLGARGQWNEEREDRLRADVRADVGEAFAQAEGAEKAAPKTLFEDVYQGMPWHLREQSDSLAGGGYG